MTIKTGKAKYNFKCKIKVDTFVTCRDTQQPSCVVIFDTRNMNSSTEEPRAPMHMGNSVFTPSAILE